MHRTTKGKIDHIEFSFKQITFQTSIIIWLGFFSPFGGEVFEKEEEEENGF